VELIEVGATEAAVFEETREDEAEEDDDGAGQRDSWSTLAAIMLRG